MCEHEGRDFKMSDWSFDVLCALLLLAGWIFECQSCEIKLYDPSKVVEYFLVWEIF